MPRGTLSGCRALVVAGLVLITGCHSLPDKLPVVEAPRELQKVTHPPYVIEPPDILLVDAVRLVPLPPYKISPLDALSISVPNALPNEPLSGVIPVEPDGTLNLGPSYKSVNVLDMTTDQARDAIVKHLTALGIKDPQVSVSLAQSRAAQQIRGEHLVRPDGTLGLGTYGSVYVAGLTLDQARAAIETHLSAHPTSPLFRPEVSVDVGAYNSKVYYVITDGAGSGEQVVRLPATGNETVLDAMSNVGGLSAVASKKRIWVSRPAPAACGGDQVLPVDWVGLTQRGQTETNYQVLPGDRVYVMSQPLVGVDTYLARLFAPLERMFGITLLGNETIRSVAGQNTGGNGGGF